MKKAFIYILALFVCCACSTDEDTTPSNADTDRLETLIDTDIDGVVSFRLKYGTYIMYKFDKSLDFAYQFEQASGWTGARLTEIGHDDAVAAVNMLYANVFSCYDDSFKLRRFPRKLLLASEINSVSELGLSVPENGRHTAVANINSVTFAGMSRQNVEAVCADDSKMDKVCGEMHRALLADYLVKSRGEFPVGDDYFTFSLNDYSSLMSPGRKNAAQLVKDDPDFFYNRGFFFPDDDESTYFPSAEDDVLAFIRKFIVMDKDMADALYDMPLMAAKMHLLTVGLQNMGVDVVRINPNAEQFVKMEYVQPAVMYSDDVVTDGPEATVKVTILRGSHELSHLVVLVGGKEQSTVDLTQYDRMKVEVDVKIDGLQKGGNAVTLKLYEQGRDKVAAVYETGVSYASMDEVIGFTIKKENDHEDVFRRLKLSVGEGGDIDNEQNPDLTTVAFEKHGWLDRYFEEKDAEYRYWKMYRKDGRVVTINEYLRDGFNEDYTAPLYRMTGSYAFCYNESGELTEVTWTDDRNVTAVVVSDVVYVSGRIARYTYKGRVYEPAYRTVDGVTVRVDCLDDRMSGLQFAFDGTEDLNPYYMPELPAVLPGSMSEIPLQLLYSKYLFKGLGDMWNGGWTKVLEDKLNVAEVSIGGVKWSYRFKLK